MTDESKNQTTVVTQAVAAAAVAAAPKSNTSIPGRAWSAVKNFFKAIGGFFSQLFSRVKKPSLNTAGNGDLTVVPTQDKSLSVQVLPSLNTFKSLDDMLLKSSYPVPQAGESPMNEYLKMALIASTHNQLTAMKLLPPKQFVMADPYSIEKSFLGKLNMHTRDNTDPAVVAQRHSEMKTIATHFLREAARFEITEKNVKRRSTNAEAQTLLEGIIKRFNTAASELKTDFNLETLTGLTVQKLLNERHCSLEYEVLPTQAVSAEHAEKQNPTIIHTSVPSGSASSSSKEAPAEVVAEPVKAVPGSPRVGG